jgi:hypothetical protein
LLEEIHGLLLGLAVAAHIGHRIEPMANRGGEGAEVGDVETGEEVFFGSLVSPVGRNPL